MSEIPDINRTLFRIAKKLTSDNVEDIKLLYNDVIGERKLEEATDGKALLKLLKENNYLNTSEKVEKFCEDILIEIGREDIRNEILGKSCEGKKNFRFLFFFVLIQTFKSVLFVKKMTCISLQI